MTFLNPFGLISLLSLPVILILHLLRERRRKHDVSSIFLWRFLEKEVKGNRFRKIPFSWLLLCDLMIAALLSFALARPQISINFPQARAKHLILLLDVSTSMRATDVQPSRFSQARLEALRILNAIGPRDIATIITFGSTTHLLADTREVAFEDVIDSISAIKPGGTGNSLPTALALASSVRENRLPAEIHLLTDVSFGQMDLSDFPLSLEWHTFAGRANNQAILAISAKQLRHDRLQVLARVVNYDSADVSRIISIYLNDVPVDNRSVSIPGKSEVVQVWDLKGAPNYVKALLMGVDDLPEDDSAQTPINRESELQIVLVKPSEAISMSTTNPKFDPVSSAIAALPNIYVRVIESHEYNSQTDADLTIFDRFLPDTLPDHPILILQPPYGSYDMLGVTFNKFVEVPVGARLKRHSQSEVFDSIDFNGVQWRKSREIEDPAGKFSILMSVNDIPVIISGSQQDQPVTILLVDILSSNLSKHPAFPLVFSNMTENLRGIASGREGLAGEDIPLPLPASSIGLEVVTPKGETTTYTNPWPSRWFDTKDPGVYVLTIIDQDGHRNEIYHTINAGEEIESDIVQKEMQGKSTTAGMVDELRVEKGLDLLPWLLGFAVLFLILEARLAWR